MPVKSLETYLFERGLAASFPIEVLKNSRLGIDVNHYLSRLISFKREMYLDATGGFPQSLKLFIESDIQIFKELNITPIFVFSGNDIADQFALSNTKEASPADKVRDASWRKYSNIVNSHPPSILPVTSVAPITFRDHYSPFNTASIFSELIKFLQKKGLEYIRAPYLSWVQLSYLYDTNYIDAIYGPTETLLLANVDKFIFGMEILSREFRYIDKLKVLSELGINPTQLLDIAVSVGCDLQPVTLPIYQGYVPTSALFDVGLEIISTTGSIYHSILSLNNDAITEKFQKGVLSLQFMPVLKSNGRVELLNFDEQNTSDPNLQPPTDVHDIIGQRLPHEYYFYESIGLIQPKILEAIVFGTYVEAQPLDGIITKEYRSTCNKIADSFKNKGINLLTQNMARYYQMKKIHYIKPFDSPEVELENRMNPPLYYKISPIATRSDKEEFNLDELLKSLTRDDLIVTGETKIDNNDDEKKLNKNHEIISTSFLRLLHLLGFLEVSNNKIVQNAWTQALLKIPELEGSFRTEQYILLLIFLKINAFGLQENLSANLIGSSKTKDPEQKSIVQLISRLALFINAEQEQQSYAGPISRSLLNVRSSIDLVKSNTRELLDSILVNSLANNEASKLSRSNKEWRELVAEVPFAEVSPNTILSIILQTFLDQFYIGNTLEASKTTTFDHFKISGSSTKDTPTIEHLKTPGVSIKDVSGSFYDGFKFVKESFKLIEILNKGKLIDDVLYQTFIKAEKLSKEVLKLQK